MLLKKADDKSKRIALLEDLQRSTVLQARQKQWLREELSRLRKGIQGEQESAYYLDQYFKNGENHVVLHDLRLVVDGDVAQIDHLIINRGFGVYLIETKNYAGSVHVNPHGEFTVDYDGDRFGVPSPIEQSKRHERILQRLLERLEITSRTGAPLTCYHVVMFHPRAVIGRPKISEFDTRNVIKSDQFPSWHQQFVDRELGVLNTLKLMANVRSIDTIREWGEKLMRQHRPAPLLELPEFMQPNQTPEIKPISTVAPAVAPAAPAAVQVEQGKKKLVCLHCNVKISYPEGKFCWNNEKRFKGGQYCREHQALHS